MARLGVNVDHIATIRQARGSKEPAPVAAALLADLGGADGIVVHLREDRRHIQERDLELLRELLLIPLNLEMAATEEMGTIAERVNPDKVTLVPERRQELTTEGGLAVTTQRDHLKVFIQHLHASDIPVCLFVDPDPDQIRSAQGVGADGIELHTGRFANCRDPKGNHLEFEALKQGAQLGHSLGLDIHAGHGLNYHNIHPLIGISEITEFNIGHSIIARAVLVGMERAVREMKALLVVPGSLP